MGKAVVVVALFVFVYVTESFSGVVFDLRDRSSMDPDGLTIEDLDEATSFALVRDGITAYLSAYVDGALSGLLNQTQGGFGINASPTGDTTDQIDANQGVESARISFDQDLFILSLDASSLGSDTALLTIGNHSPVVLDSAGFESTDGLLLGVGETLEILHLEGNGFSMDSFEVAVVPEPTARSLMLLGIGVWAIYRKKRVRL